MSDQKETVDALASLMREFGLSEAMLRRGDVVVSFRQPLQPAAEGVAEGYATVPIMEAAPMVEAPKGTPVNSPMNGIYYGAPSPNSSPFVKEGESVSAGQVVALIEAMKVFNEITATVNGTVTKILVETGQVVQPGDTLMLIQ